MERIKVKFQTKKEPVHDRLVPGNGPGLLLESVYRGWLCYGGRRAGSICVATEDDNSI